MTEDAPRQLLYTPDQAAAVLGISRTKAWELTRDGSLLSTKIGKRRLIFADSIEEYVRSLRDGTGR